MVTALPTFSVRLGASESQLQWITAAYTLAWAGLLLPIGKLGDKDFVIVTARGGGYGPGTPREGWDHREPWLRQALTSLGVTDATFVHTELTLARESPAMIPLDLGVAEDKSLAEAFATIDGLLSA